MSIASLARSRAIRTTPPPPKPPTDALGDLEMPTDDKSKKTISEALTAVAAYVPSEVIAIYTLVIAMTVSNAGAVGADGKAAPAMLPLWAFYAFLGAIPLFVWLLFAVNKVEAKEPIPWQPSKWPYWESISSMIAFTVWSAALPKSAFLRWDDFSAPIASIALVIVSILLPLVGVLVTKKPAGTEAPE